MDLDLDALEREWSERTDTEAETVRALITRVRELEVERHAIVKNLSDAHDCCCHLGGKSYSCCFEQAVKSAIDVYEPGTEE